MENRAEQRGAVFTVSLPLRRHPIEGARPEGQISGAHDMPVLDGVRILVVDDDAAAREMVTATLEYCGAQVAAVASAVEARRRLPGTNWDLLLIDIAMPGEDGYTLIRDIRSTGLKQLTAQARDIDRAQALAAGFDAHISKPVEARTLAHAVATLIGGAGATIT